MPKHIFLKIGFITLIYGCALPPPGVLSQEDEAAIADAVEQSQNDYCDAALKRDINFFPEYWADTEEFVFAWDGELWAGRAGYDRLGNETREWFDQNEKVLSCKMSNGHAYVLAEDAVSYTNEFEWSIVTTAGDTVKSWGSGTYVFKLLNGKWRVIHSAGTHLYEQRDSTEVGVEG
jgi:hypothetical protein